MKEDRLSDSVAGQIVILNGAPRSGKSSIAAAIQETFEGVWLNTGVDAFMAMTPQRYRPGLGLRPGGERPDLEPLVVLLYRAMYETIAAWSSLGLNVVVDVGHHDVYSVPRAILPDCARRLSGLPVLFVGVRCPIDVVIERRHATWGDGAIGGGPIPALREGDGGSEPMLSESDGRSVPSPVRLWQDAVHTPGIYDLEVDTSVLSPEECAGVIRARLDAGQPPSAFRRLADTASV